MAMIKCPECGKDISSLAQSCPSCGFPIKEYLAPKKYFYYCPICGEHYYENRFEPDLCTRCLNFTTIQRSLYDQNYYYDKGEQLYGDSIEAFKVLEDEEISKNPLYNPNTTEHNAVEELARRERARGIVYEAPSRVEANAPKCPSCGSTDIEKISTLNRAVSIGFLGLASPKIGKQYECKKCKHKW